MAARIEATKDININLNINVTGPTPTTPTESAPTNPTLEKVREVAGKVLFVIGLIVTTGVVLGLAGHVIGIVSVSALTLAMLFVIGHNLTMWGYSMWSGKPGEGPKLGISLEPKIDLAAIAAKADAK